MIDSQRRQVLKAVGGVGALFAVGSASATPGRRQGASAESTIYEIAAGGDDFETLEFALEATGLDAVLDAAGRQYTVFAPTDEAFSQIPVPSDLDVLESILLYHVTPGRRYASSVVNAPKLEMLSGGSVAVDGTSLNGGQATIQVTDIEASNGVVHVIDGVLLP